jgi:BirA family biotin operon repressor/biotin-[acetyl-CoA-carboxylase] ligase
MMDEQLSSSSVEQALSTRRLGNPVLYFESVSSTNDVAAEQAAAGAPEGLLVLANEQTAGRGRLDRIWWAPAGSSLLISILLRPPILAGHAGQLTMCLGLAAAEGIEDVTGRRPALKWPNDLLLNGHKLGGMLTELRLDGERVESAVLGLGLNVNLDFQKAPPDQVDLTRNAISLQMVLGRPVARLPLLAAILARCEAWYGRLLAGQSPAVAWSARLDTLGRRVSVAMPGGSLEGIATGVNPEGALLVRGDDGRTTIVWAGDVTSVRDA